MGNFMRQAVGSLLGSLQAAGGESVTYWYGDLAIGVVAVKGESTFETSTHSGLVEQSRSVDWLISSVDLTVGGDKVEPRRGDLIEHGDHVYEVMPVDNEKPWMYSDPYRTIMRVHSKLRRIEDE